MVMKFQRTSAAVGITLIGRAVPDIFEWIVEQIDNGGAVHLGVFSVLSVIGFNGPYKGPHIFRSTLEDEAVRIRGCPKVFMY